MRVSASPGNAVGGAGNPKWYACMMRRRARMRSLANRSGCWGTALCQAAVAGVKTRYPRMLPRELRTLYTICAAPGNTPARHKSLRVSGSLAKPVGCWCLRPSGLSQNRTKTLAHVAARVLNARVRRRSRGRPYSRAEGVRAQMASPVWTLERGAYLF